MTTWFLVFVLGFYEFSGAVAIPQASEAACEAEAERIGKKYHTTKGNKAVMCVQGVQK